MDDAIVQEVLSFWFEDGTVPGLCEYRPIWIVSTPDFDAAIAQRFGQAHARAARGELDHLAARSRGALALIILLDQFSRNLFRGNSRAFACDAKARALCNGMIARQEDLALTRMQRIFCYLPLQHSESLDDQVRSVKLFDSLGEDKVFHFIQGAARRHLDIIERFGRFPHRNQVLNRRSTAAEHAFLQSEEGAFWTG